MANVPVLYTYGSHINTATTLERQTSSYRESGMQRATVFIASEGYRKPAQIVRLPEYCTTYEAQDENSRHSRSSSSSSVFLLDPVRYIHLKAL